MSHPGLLARIAAALHRRWQGAIIACPYFWMLLFFLAPFLIIFKISFSEVVIASPPIRDILDWSNGWPPSVHYTLENYQYLSEDSLYRESYLNSVKIAAMSTLCCLLLGFPMAYGIARARPTRRNILLLLVMLPFWTSFLLRVYAWIGIISKNGVLNDFLLWLGLVDEPLRLMHTEFAVFLGITYTYLPFMILPLYANLERLNISLLEASADLGARPWRSFVDVTLPLSLPGIIAGSLLVFIPANGEYVIPALMGGAGSLMVGRTLYDEFFLNRDWAVASSVAIVLLALLVAPIMFFQHYQTKQAEAKS